jgi:hypothetical protein
MYGLVQTTYANPQYQQENCKTPIIPESWDQDYSADTVGITCMTINYAAQSFSTYQQYMSAWADLMRTGNGTAEQQYRPAPVALLYQNTTINGTWIDTIDTVAVSKAHNRVINNVTLAMPHIGVFQAARDPLSDILQPEVCRLTCLSWAYICSNLTDWVCTRSGPPFRAHTSMCCVRTLGQTKLHHWYTKRR